MLPRQQPDRIQKSLSMTIAWWPMLGCFCPSPWPTDIWVWVNWWTAMLTWAKPLAEPTLATRC